MNLGRQAQRVVPRPTWQQPPQRPTAPASWYILSHPVTQGLCAHSWALYEEPEFRGRKLVLPEGDVELRASGPAWSVRSIGSLRRVVWVSGLAPGAGCCPVYPGPQTLRREKDSGA